MSKTFANGITVVHQGDGQQFVAMAPDVCKTPSPGGPVPIPYPNIAMSSDLADGSKSVKVEGNPAALADSCLKMSSGDEGGTAGGGIVSSKIKGKLKWVLHSIDVKFENQGVVRFLDDNMHNGNAGNINGKSPGYPGPSQGKPITCDNCGKSIDDSSHDGVRMKSSPESDAAATGTKGRTVAGVSVKCPNAKQPSTFSGVAGDMNPRGLNQNNFAKLAKNICSGKPISPKKPTDKADAGNCAEQKALYRAIDSGQFKTGCTLSMSVVRNLENGKTIYVPSCETCQRVLTSMLCSNEAKQ
jgi:hypothetical protein